MRHWIWVLIEFFQALAKGHTEDANLQACLVLRFAGPRAVTVF
jgi:hypothetical protein